MTDFPGQERDAPPGIIARHFVEAGAFLNALRPSQRWWVDNGSDWVFRGQRCSDWNLLPPAFRQGGSEARLPLLYPAIANLITSQMAVLNLPDLGQQQQALDVVSLTVAEVVAVHGFESLADELGYGVASDEISMAIGPEWYFHGFRVHGQDLKLKIPTRQNLALAQHHGIPTRLLNDRARLRCAL